LVAKVSEPVINGNTLRNGRIGYAFPIFEDSRIKSTVGGRVLASQEIMETREITTRVDAEAAKAYAAASAEERERIDLLLSLSQVTDSSAPLGQVMRDISESARARGLTEDRLSEMLREE
jgi:hypothetical protein